MHYSGKKITTQYSTILASIFVFFFSPLCLSLRIKVRRATVGASLRLRQHSISHSRFRASESRCRRAVVSRARPLSRDYSISQRRATPTLQDAFTACQPYPGWCSRAPAPFLAWRTRQAQAVSVLLIRRPLSLLLPFPPVLFSEAMENCATSTIFGKQ